jgi:hypothetical protein
MAYCTLADVKQYLNIPTGTTTDDDLLSVIIAAAHQRINDYTKRRFEAVADATRYFDASQDTDGRVLELGYDISHISAVTNENGSAVASTEYITSPRNLTPWREIILRSTGTTTWGFTTTPEDAITVTGRWAVMDRVNVTALSRATNVVTATVDDPTAISKGATVHLVSAADATFNGSFVVTGVTGSAVTWAQTAGNATSTTGVLLLVPPSIRQACTRLTAWLYRQKDNQMGDADRPIMTGDGTIIMPTTLPGDVQALLREWVRII